MDASAMHNLQAMGASSRQGAFHPGGAGAAPLDVRSVWSQSRAPGHTSGHCAFHLPDRGVLITGDALITAHPVGKRQTLGPIQAREDDSGVDPNRASSPGHMAGQSRYDVR